MALDAGALSLLYFLLALVVAAGLVVIALHYRLQPVFLLPAAAGILVANPPSQELAATWAPFLDLLRAGLDNGLFFAFIFLGWGAGANLAPILAHPRKLVLGLFTPVGFLPVLWLGMWAGLMPGEAAGAALVGGGEGLAALFLATKLAPELIGPLGVAVFPLVGAQLLVQPYLLRLLTSRAERLRRATPTRPVSRRETLLFAAAGLILTLLLAPRAFLLTGMFFVGVIIKESGVADRLARTLANRLAEIMAALLGLTVGCLCPLPQVLTLTVVKVLALAFVGLTLAPLAVLILIKAINPLVGYKLNPLLAAAAVGLTPDAAHLAQLACRQEDPQGNILQPALALNQAAFLTATLTAGLLWGIVGGG